MEIHLNDASKDEKNTLEKVEKLYCANCEHCKLLPATKTDSTYVLRVRCSAGKWRKKIGEEKFHKYFTVTRRRPEECDAYSSMGETENFIKEFRKTLPVKDEIYYLDQKMP